MQLSTQDYRIEVSENGDATDWDQFLATTAGGHHVQTSLWGRLKATLGWRAIRIVARQENEIVAGLQLLLRPIRLLGAVAYVQKGPMIATDDERVVKDLMNELVAVVRRQRVRFLVLQPPSNGWELVPRLSEWKFRPSTFTEFPVGTTIVDLEPSLQEILSNMKSKTRYNIRLGQRKGVIVREGTVEDLPVFFQILMSTSQRQSFKEYSLDYFLTMQRIFGEQGCFKLFIAEYRGEPLASMLAIPFGDTVLFKKGGWSGRHGDLHPNESMHWYAIEWAKSHGFRYYDFESIATSVASQLCSGKTMSHDAMNPVTRFKLGFGGSVFLNPGTFEYAGAPLVRWARHITNRPQFKTIIRRFRMSSR